MACSSRTGQANTLELVSRRRSLIDAHLYIILLLKLLASVCCHPTEMRVCRDRALANLHLAVVAVLLSLPWGLSGTLYSTWNHAAWSDH